MSLLELVGFRRYSAPSPWQIHVGSHNLWGSWCAQVFPEENRELAVRCGALHRLVDAGEVQLEAMRTRPSTAVVSANHFIIASLALLLTHKVCVPFFERDPSSRLTTDV
jgi:hypothetical protein